MVTGYKPMEMGIFKENDPRVTIVKETIKRRLVGFIEEGLEWVIVSGQMGVELWTAEIVLDLKEEYDINIAIFPPFENQESRWPDHPREKYQELSFVVDFYKPLYEGEYKGPYQFREKNKWFLAKSDACLMLMDEEFPGSNKYFYQFAKDFPEYEILLITPMDLEDVVEELRMSDPDYWG